MQLFCLSKSPPLSRGGMAPLSQKHWNDSISSLAPCCRRYISRSMMCFPWPPPTTATLRPLRPADSQAVKVQPSATDTDSGSSWASQVDRYLHRRTDGQTYYSYMDSQTDD